MLGREGVTGIDRVCNLGAGKGETGGARNLWGWTLVPCVEGGRKESEGEGGWASGADSHLKLGLEAGGPPLPPSSSFQALFTQCFRVKNQSFALILGCLS